MDKEELILEYLKENPFISQQQLAKKINLSRSSVANYIAELTRKGYIKGRAYIFPENDMITCIGAINLDIKANAIDDIRYYSSNPVTMSSTYGGVARNVTENLSLLGNSVSLLSVVGNDKGGQIIIDDLKRKGVDVSLIEIVPEGRTGTYTALLDLSGEMVIALADMEINKELTPTIIEENWPKFAISKAIFLDTNAPADTIDYVIKRCHEENITLFIDTVSSLKAKRLPENLNGIEVLLPNLEELEELSGMKIRGEQDYMPAAHLVIKRGVKNIAVTLGEKGIFYITQTSSGKILPYPTKIVDVTGAGDALTAGIISSLMKGHDFKLACKYGLAAASIALQSDASVASGLNFEKLTLVIKENE